MCIRGLGGCQIRRGVYTGEPGFKSLVDQLREKNATPTPPANANKYNLVGMQPGTYYYARVGGFTVIWGYQFYMILYDFAGL